MGEPASAAAVLLMTDDPTALDPRRTPAGKMATDIRRHALQDFEADREARRRRQEELEAHLLAEPVRSVPRALSCRRPRRFGRTRLRRA